MRIVFAILMLTGMLLTGIAFADRETPTITGYTASALIKRGDWKITRITFVATANGGNFAIYDSLTQAAGVTSNIKVEGSEATSLNSKTFDFSNKPLEGSTGLYLVITTANVIIEYE